jgi:hypothetical protein
MNTICHYRPDGFARDRKQARKSVMALPATIWLTSGIVKNNNYPITLGAAQNLLAVARMRHIGPLCLDFGQNYLKQRKAQHPRMRIFSPSETALFHRHHAKLAASELFGRSYS